MSSTRELTHKINSLHNMQKVMRAMKMISSIKLRRQYSKQRPLVFFDKALEKIRKEIAAAGAFGDNPPVKGYDSTSNAHVIMFTSDKGLCGSHNSSVQKAVELLMDELRESGIEAEFTCIGNKGAHYCKRKEYEILQQAEITERTFGKSHLRKMSDRIFERFRNNEVQRIYAVGNIFHSTLNHETVTARLLPLPIPEREEEAGSIQSAETEAGSEGFVQSAAGNYLLFSLRSMLLHSYLSEHSSRMTAMENATNNSKDLIDKYTAVQNHMRQAAITNELAEIVAGKEALKGL